VSPFDPTKTFDPTRDCADASKKDLFFEIDYMGPPSGKIQSHKPDTTALNQVVTAFSNAPTPPGPVRLHVQVDDQIAHNDTTAFVPCTPAAASGEADFDLLKAQFFGTANERNAVNGGTVNSRNAKALAFRYGLFVHNISPAGNTTSGCAEIGGNDFVVSLGTWAVVVDHNVGNTDQQAGTFMHEVGHTLGLRHGGGDNINCKPNYISVMNYTRQGYNPALRVLDYSRGVYGVPLAGGGIGLVKSNLNETDGIRRGDPIQSGPTIGVVNIAYGPLALGQLAVNPATNSSGVSLGMDWNRNKVTGDGVFSKDIDQATSSSGGCPVTQKDPLTQQEVTVLVGYNDWANLQYNPRVSVDVSDGARTPLEKSPDETQPEITYETARGMSRWRMDAKGNDPKNLIVRSVQNTLPVAIFSSLNDAGTAVELDATTIVQTSLILRGATWFVPVNLSSNGKAQCTVRDVDKDNHDDLVCNFTIPANTIGLNETMVVLEGMINTGGTVFSQDSVQVSP
jgi:hypothetical protein